MRVQSETTGKIYTLDVPEGTSEGDIAAFIAEHEGRPPPSIAEVAEKEPSQLNNFLKETLNNQNASEEILEGLPGGVPSTLRQVQYGWESSRTAPQNFATYLEAKFPLLSYELNIPVDLVPGLTDEYTEKTGMDLFKTYGIVTTPEEKYGKDFRSLTEQQRRERINQVQTEATARKFKDVLDAGKQDSIPSLLGHITGAIASPETLAPIGSTYKAATAIGAVLGVEYSVAEQLAQGGEVSFEPTAKAAAVGAIAAPVTLFAGRKIAENWRKLRNKNASVRNANTSTAEQLKYESLMEVEKVNKAYMEVAKSGMPPRQWRAVVMEKVGLDSGELAKHVARSGHKVHVPTQTEAKMFSDIPDVGATPSYLNKTGPLSYLFGVVGDRIRNVSPRVHSALTKFQLDVNQTTFTRQQIIEPFAKLFRGSSVTELALDPRNIPSKLARTENKLSVQDQAKVSKYLINGEFDNARTVFARYGKEFLESFESMIKFLDDIHNDLTKSGYKNLSYLPNYWPRVLKDPEGLKAALDKDTRGVIDEAINKRLAQLQKQSKPNEEGLPESIKLLFKDEEAAIINNVLRGYLPKIDGSGLSFVKKRQLVKVNDELLKYYEDPITSLFTYAEQTAHNAAKRRFFGISGKPRSGTIGSTLDIEESIGALVREETNANNLLPKEQDELARLLHARFVNGEKGAHKALQIFRNLNYMTILGNAGSAIIQLADTGTVAFKYGIRNTLMGIMDVARTSKALGHKNVDATMKAFGLDRLVNEELMNEQALSKTLHVVMTYGLFRGIDKLTKNITIMSALRQGQAHARKLQKEGFYGKDKSLQPREVPKTKLRLLGAKKLEYKYKEAYGDEFDALVDDLASGEITPRVQHYLFTELTNLQPVSLLEQTEGYLNHPNLRMFYQLKTFFIRHLNMLRTEIPRTFADGHYAEATKNALVYSLLVPTGTAFNTMGKNVVLGREESIDLEDLPDEYFNSLLKIFGANEYVLQRYQRPSEIAKATLFPPFTMFDDAFKTISGLVEGEDPKYDTLIRNAPIFGTFIYNYFGPGIENYQKAQKKSKGKTYSASELSGF